MTATPALREDRECRDAKRNRDVWVLWIVRKVPGLYEILKSLVVTRDDVMASMASNAAASTPAIASRGAATRNAPPASRPRTCESVRFAPARSW